MAAQENVARLYRVIEAVRDIDFEMPRHHLAFLLYVSMRPGKTQVEIAGELGVTPSSITRTVAKLSEWQTFGKRGLSLVFNETDPQHRSRHVITLTARGERLIEKMVDAMSK